MTRRGAIRAAKSNASASTVTPVKSRRKKPDTKKSAPKTKPKRKRGKPSGDSPDGKNQKPSSPAAAPATATENADDSASQATLVTKTSITLKVHKIFLVINVPDPIQDYVKDCTTAINAWLQVVLEQDEHAGLALWTLQGSPRSVLTEMPNKVSVWEKHVYGFRANRKRGGSQYWRVNLALSATTDIKDVLTELQRWEDKPKQWAKLAPTTANEPVQIGWFLRSIRAMIDAPHWQDLLRMAIGVDVGLSWIKIMDGTFKKVGVPYAVHVECDNRDKLTVLNYMKRTYGRKPTKSPPTEAKVYFIKNQTIPGVVMSGTEKAVLGKLVSYQKNHQKVIGYEFNDKITDIDEKVKYQLKTLPLRQVLMSLKVKAIEGRIGDRLFLSIDESIRRGVQGFQFTYHKYVKAEAEQVACHLPLFLRSTLKLDPICCCTQPYVEMYEDWTWDKKRNLSCNKEGEELQHMALEMSEFLGSDAELDELEIDKDNASITEKDYRRLTGKDDETLATLTNPSAKPRPKAIASSGSSNVSALTGSTTESKARRYADAAVQDVSRQYAQQLQEQKKQFEAHCHTQHTAMKAMLKSMASQGLDTSNITRMLAPPEDSTRGGGFLSVLEDGTQHSGQDSGSERQKLDFEQEAPGSSKNPVAVEKSGGNTSSDEAKSTSDATGKEEYVEDEEEEDCEEDEVEEEDDDENESNEDKEEDKDKEDDSDGKHDNGKDKEDGDDGVGSEDKGSVDSHHSADGDSNNSHPGEHSEDEADSHRSSETSQNELKKRQEQGNHKEDAKSRSASHAVYGPRNKHGFLTFKNLNMKEIMRQTKEQPPSLDSSWERFENRLKSSRKTTEVLRQEIHEIDKGESSSISSLSYPAENAFSPRKTRRQRQLTYIEEKRAGAITGKCV